MKKRYLALVVGVLGVAGGCRDFLDVNTNPNAPQLVTANLYLPPMLHWMVTSPAFDGRFIGHIAQEWYSTSTATSPVQTWGRMGYDPLSDNGAQQWRDYYWNFGQNLVDMNTKAEAEQRWDVLGVGQILKAWGWQSLTDLHGEIIIKQAFDPSRFTFDYDSQQFAYEEVQRLLGEAITNLGKTTGAVDQTYLARGDKMYNGDRGKWTKFAYGLLAMNLNHYSNKSSYKPLDVIAAVDRSFASNADDALLTYPNTNNDDTSFLGPFRNNLPLYRQSQFIVNLMNGTVFGGAVDPRLSRMLAPSPDGSFRGLDINAGLTSIPAAQQPGNLFRRYLFDDKAKLPAITYAQLQFVKAEAAFRVGNRALALQAYTNGISSHIDFVNARNTDNGQLPTQITAAEKAAFLANPAIVPTSPANLTLSMIMSQKYIAQWGWGHNELWMDLRRYNYTGTDPQTGQQVFPTFTPPASLYVDNGGKLAQRIRPRYNSEYVWNAKGLEAIGGLALDYHTKPLWITQP